jgi:hypothetical protein
LFTKPASVAISIKYEKGRTLLLVALSSVRVTGCASFRMRCPSRGWTGLGAVMFTPGSGPAIVGLSGFSDFVSVQPAPVRESRRSPDVNGLFINILPEQPDVRAGLGDRRYYREAVCNL